MQIKEQFSTIALNYRPIFLKCQRGFAPTGVDLIRARERAELLTGQGFGPADAAHLALAEAKGADFISCDDRLLHQCRHVRSSVWSGSPIAFCEKENLQ